MPLSVTAYRVLVALVLLLSVLTAIVLGRVYGAPVAVGPFDHYRCSTGDRSGGEGVFRVLSTTNYLAQTFADHLCASNRIAARFEAVDISWQPREQLTTRQLARQHFHLLWNRQRVLKGLLSNYDRFYDSVQKTPDYSVYWLSNGDTPRLTAGYFAGKRVGLIQDSQSQSSFQQPMGQLQAAGITLSDRQLHFFADRRALYQAFAEGRIDLMSGIKWVGEQEVPPERRLAIAENLPTGRWFLSRSLAADVEFRCALLVQMDVFKGLYAHIDPTFEPAHGECPP
ncbi:hypothetical protein [Marinobacter mangrovi]|uniref:hypothetical protein n=1 Tax=Marinobacter mangrovi TaxID=2803918 RepID=UPI0019335514|nr:hypothetical protein [Marinobacter mangrovi]